ncbi:MAG: hypothetical protein EBR83_10210, partial [Verrucomicrobia bacterium]|nr:hypothetical protein [Verrucomicrobiota bacterium]
GFVVGVVQNGMSIGDAMQRYSLLTVGDGLVSQIPALIISIGAGLLVTRASDNNNLGTQVSGQLIRYPRALTIAAGTDPFIEASVCPSITIRALPNCFASAPTSSSTRSTVGSYASSTSLPSNRRTIRFRRSQLFGKKWMTTVLVRISSFSARICESVFGGRARAYSSFVSPYFGSAPSFWITEKSITWSNGTGGLEIAPTRRYRLYDCFQIRSKLAGLLRLMKNW